MNNVSDLVFVDPYTMGVAGQLLSGLDCSSKEEDTRSVERSIYNDDSLDSSRRLLVICHYSSSPPASSSAAAAAAAAAASSASIRAASSAARITSAASQVSKTLLQALINAPTANENPDAPSASSPPIVSRRAAVFSASKAAPSIALSAATCTSTSAV